MKTKTITLYEYSELSPEAKEKALNAWNKDNDDPFMQSHMINLLKEELDECGIEYDTDSIDVNYSLSSCQGDGFMFKGVFYPDYGAGRCYIATIKHDGHYYHKYSRQIDWVDSDTAEEASETEGDEGKDYRAFVATYEAICDKMERAGYDHIEYVTSEESFQEACEANEYTFREDGTMENLTEDITETDKFYSCIRLHKDDIIEQGFDPKDLTDEQMQRMADKIGEACMDNWWVALETYCEEIELPSNGNGQRQ